MNKAVSYIRVSTDEQAQQFSLPAQRKQLTELAKTKKLRIIKVYNEGGISGESLAARPQMLQLLEDAETGNFSFLLITALDRLSRNLKDSLYIRSKLQEAGVTIITPSQEFSHDSIDHDFTANLFGSMADYERKRILERCQQGRIEKRAKGGWLGGIPPKGYKYSSTSKNLLINENEADEIRTILEASINHSPYYASLELNKHGIKVTPRQIRRMTEKHKILFYSGKTIDYSNNIIKAKWKPIISNEMATQLLNAKHTRRTVGPKSTTANHLLTGLGIFKCRLCGRTIKTFTGGNNKSRKRLTYYRCSSRQYGEFCKNRKGWRVHILDMAVIDETVRVLSNLPELERAYRDHIAEKQDSKAVKRLTNRLNTVQNKRNRLFEAVESGAIPMEDVSDRFQKLKAEEAEIQLQIDSLQASVEIPDFEALKIASLDFNFRTDLTTEKKRQIISILFDRIELGKRSLYLNNVTKIRSSEARIRLP